MTFGRKRTSQSDQSPERLFIARADAARDEGRFRDAAALYEEALRISPRLGGIHVQAGHMRKEAGDLDRAEAHYLAAAALMPDDADLALQFGHFYKLTGRLDKVASSYERALELAPNWQEPRDELERLRALGWHAPAERDQTERAIAEIDFADPTLDGARRDLKLASLYGRMAPENLPRPLHEMLHHSADSINLRQFGVGLNTFWGMKPVLRGVEAIRGFCISASPLTTVDAKINGLSIHRGPMKGPYELEYEPDKSRIHKYVFNIWCDLSGFAPGLYELELTFSHPGQKPRRLREEFVVEAPLLEADHPESDGVINLDPGAPGSIEDQINARPSAVHLAERPNMLPEIRNILVMRADQLGDLVASIPGIVRLRELFPNARLVGVLGPPNVDLAIDLSQSLMSRPLLGLTGARFTYGFKDPNWPRLSASVDDAYYDPKNHREIATHSTRIVTMIDRLGSLMSSSARIIRRPDLARDRLRAYGIAEDDRYAMLHMGARIVFSRWPHYLELASQLLRETDLKVVLFTGDPNLRERFTPDLTESDRIIVLDQQLPFDDFDAFLSYCAVYVGNDSGPKHLASLRGVPVVSIHSSRINWSEWGQEHTGVIITRKVPCAGCTLYHDVDECGKDYVCVNGIPLKDVYDAVRRYV